MLYMVFKLKAMIRSFSYVDIIVLTFVIPFLGYLFYMNQFMSIMLLDQKALIGQLQAYNEAQSNVINDLSLVNSVQREEIQYLKKELAGSGTMVSVLAISFLLLVIIPPSLNPLSYSYKLTLPIISTYYNYFMGQNDSNALPNQIYTEFMDALGNNSTFSLTQSGEDAIIHIFQEGQFYITKTKLDDLCSTLVSESVIATVTKRPDGLHDVTLTLLNHLFN